MEIILPMVGSVLIFLLVFPFVCPFEQVDARKTTEQRRKVWATSPMPMPKNQQEAYSYEYRQAQKILLSAFPDEEDLDLSCLSEYDPPYPII